MTLEEAKKILEEEGFKLGGPGKPGVVSEDFAEYESPEICEAMQIVCSAGFQLAMLAGIFDERKERLKKEYEKNTKAPCSGEEQPKENSLKAATDAFILQANEIMRLKKKNAELLEAIDKVKEGNPALKEASSQFNDALLDEQAKEIKRLGKEISKLNGIIHKKNLKIEELRKESSRHLRGKIKMFGENVDLEQMLKDKNAILSDVAEELRLTKIREKNLAKLGLKYVGENEKLKKELADKVVDKIDAQALKSAESALAWKEKVIAEKDEVIEELKEKLKSINMNRHNERIYKKQLAEKNEVIVDLGRKLNTQKDLADDISLKYDGAKYNLKLRIDECEKLKKELEKMTKLIETVRKGSKEYCDYGIAAGKMIQKMAKVIVNEGPVSSEDFKEYRRLVNGGIFMPEISEEELMKLQEKVCADIAEEGKDLSGVIVLCGKDYVDALKKVKDVWQE